MFSATWPNEVRSLAQDFQVDPVFLNVGSMELSANHNIQQHVEIIDENDKQARLFQLLEHIMQQVLNFHYFKELLMLKKFVKYFL